MYQTKLEVIVQSKYQAILDEFLLGFKPTTEKFANLKLHVLQGTDFGAPAINPILIDAYKSGTFALGVLNDDLWFVEGWLEDVVNKLQTYDAVSPGYVETDNFDKFLQAIEKTEEEDGVVEHFYGPCGFFKTKIFRQIGMFDEQFSWSCDDLDLAWRMKLNGLKSVTSKKITTGHLVGATRNKSNESISAWNVASDKAKQQFYDKHGYQSYRDIRKEYKKAHQYFVEFK